MIIFIFRLFTNRRKRSNDEPSLASKIVMDFRPHGAGQKKLIIKNFSGPRKLPKNYELDTWKMLEEAVRAIQNRSTYVRFSLEKLNQIVANLVDGNKEIAKKIHMVRK